MAVGMASLLPAGLSVIGDACLAGLSNNDKKQ
jgi:hypothetical protein